MNAKTVLLVDDDADLHELVRHAFERDGFEVPAVTSAQAALDRLAHETPDAVLLDIMMPGRLSGLDVLRSLRARPGTRRLPVVVVSALASEHDRVTGLELGADDYVVKPFSPRELVARVKAILRRRESERREPPLAFGTLTIDLERREATVDGAPCAFTTHELDLLVSLVREPGRAFTRAELMARSHRTDGAPVTDRVVDTHVASIRRKLGATGAAIETVRGFGYRLKPPS